MEIKKVIKRVLKNKTRKATVKENDVKYVLQQDVEFTNVYLVFLSHVSDEPYFVGTIEQPTNETYNFKKMTNNQEVIFNYLTDLEEIEEKTFL